MHNPRGAYGAAALNGLIYVAGGEDENGEINSVECYNPVKNRWKILSNMNAKRSQLTLIEHQGSLYAIGGGSKTIESYNPETNAWTNIAENNKFEFFMNATIGQNEIFALDGESMYNQLKFECKKIVYRSVLDRHYFFTR